MLYDINTSTGCCTEQSYVFFQ